MLHNIILRQARVGITILLHVTTTPVHKKVCVLLATVCSFLHTHCCNLCVFANLCVLGVDCESDR